MRRIPALVLMALSAALVLLTAWPAEAGREPDHLLLGRIWVSERGWDASPEEVAIWQVLHRRCRIGHMRRSLRATMRAYAPRATGARRVPSTSREAWVQGLRIDGEAPGLWGISPGSTEAGWSGYREAWMELLDRARARLDDTDGRTSPCSEPPDFWASPTADRWLIRRATRAGRWIPVNCGPTRNRFFRRPHEEDRQVLPDTVSASPDSATIR